MIRESEKRRHGKKLLTIPALNRLREQAYEHEINDLMATAGKLIAQSQLVFRWRIASGLSALVYWSSTSKQFNLLDNPSWCEFLGTHFDLVDSQGMNFGLPHASVASRIYEECLKDSVNLPIADWQLCDQWRREGK